MSKKLLGQPPSVLLSKLKQMKASASALQLSPPTNRERIAPARAVAAKKALATKSNSFPHFHLLIPFIIGFTIDRLSFLFAEASKKSKGTETSWLATQESSTHKLRKSSR